MLLRLKYVKRDLEKREGEMRAFTVALSIIAILLIGLFIGYLLWGPAWEVPQELKYGKYEVLKDTLIIVLTLAAVAIAVLGAAVYVIVRQRLETETAKRITEETRRWISWLATSTGYSFSEMGSIEQAIRLTKEAHGYAQELDEREPKNQLLIGEIRNNLASYFVQVNKEGGLARGYAEYIHKKSHKFPKQRETWERTYNEVVKAFPDQKQKSIGEKEV